MDTLICLLFLFAAAFVLRSGGVVFGCSAVCRQKLIGYDAVKAISCFMFAFSSGISYGQSVNSGVHSMSAGQCQGKEVRMIGDFYTSYGMNIADSADGRNDTLVRRSLTPGLIARMKRVASATNCDPIIRAQDFDKAAAKTFEVKHLENNWYMVSYAFGSAERTNIPLRLAETDGRLLIDYITPEWHGLLYGDSLLWDAEHRMAVDYSTPLSFVETFYAAYVQEYCSMPADLSSRLGALRLKHCTQNALEQIRLANENDDFPGYDLLIDYFDFDRLWVRSMTCVPIAADSFRVTYTCWKNVVKTVYVGIVKKERAYLIDKVWTEDRK